MPLGPVAQCALAGLQHFSFRSLKPLPQGLPRPPTSPSWQGRLQFSSAAPSLPPVPVTEASQPRSHLICTLGFDKAILHLKWYLRQFGEEMGEGQVPNLAGHCCCSPGTQLELALMAPAFTLPRGKPQQEGASAQTLSVQEGARQQDQMLQV